MSIDNLLLILTVTGIHFLAAISPGPNFLISAKHGLSYSRRTALFTTTGVATGTLTYVILGFLGLSAIVAQSVWIYNIIKYLGAAYLIYLGISSILSKDSNLSLDQIQTENKKQISNFRAYRIGLFTMFANPKAPVYYVALFTTVISPDTPFCVKLTLTILIPAISWLWYSTVALSLSLPKFKRLYNKFYQWADITFGILMIGIGLKIVFERE